MLTLFLILVILTLAMARLRGWNERQIEEYKELRERNPSRENTGVSPQAPVGRNWQVVRRIAGSPDADGLYPGKILWKPATSSIQQINDCWIDPGDPDSIPKENKPCIGVQSGYRTDDGLAVFWVLDTNPACPGTATAGYSVGGDNILQLDEDGCLHCIQTQACE
jgi:hypothetical protein